MAVSEKAFEILKKSRCADISDALDSMFEAVLQLHRGMWFYPV